MPKPNISLTTQAINYIEANLNSRLDLTTILLTPHLQPNAGPHTTFLCSKASANRSRPAFGKFNASYH